MSNEQESHVLWGKRVMLVDGRGVVPDACAGCDVRQECIKAVNISYLSEDNNYDAQLAAFGTACIDVYDGQGYYVEA